MQRTTFNFDSPAGYSLAGRLDQPTGEPRGWAIFAHCFTCGKDIRAAARIARALARHGIGVLRFDFAGLGGSGGEFADSSFAADVRDLVAAAKALAAAGMPPSLLVGHSLGGTAVLAAAGEIPDVRAVATIAAPADISHVLTQFDPASLARIESSGEAEVQLAARPFTVRKGFIDDLRVQDLLPRVGALHRPLLIMHAPGDDTVNIDSATRLFGAAHHPKSFVSLDDADHLLTRPADADYVAGMIASWASRYLPVEESDDLSLQEVAGVIASETGMGRFQTELRTGHTRIVADEPESVGGMNSGPSPYDLVCAGLAACTTMTMRMYAERKQLPLERVHVHVTHEKLADITPADIFSRCITLEGPLDDTQKQSLLRIADRCPVDLTLTRGAEVKTLLEGS